MMPSRQSIRRPAYLLCTNESLSQACLLQDNNQLNPLPVGSYCSYSKDIRLNLPLVIRVPYSEQGPPLASLLTAGRLTTFNYLWKERPAGERENTHTHTPKGTTCSPQGEMWDHLHMFIFHRNDCSTGERKKVISSRPAGAIRSCEGFNENVDRQTHFMRCSDQDAERLHREGELGQEASGAPAAPKSSHTSIKRFIMLKHISDTPLLSRLVRVSTKQAGRCITFLVSEERKIYIRVSVLTANH
ncbi:unnamed protein product [Leuciscus chuanchicus]